MLIVKNNKLLLKNNKIATDKKCCCGGPGECCDGILPTRVRVSWGRVYSDGGTQDFYLNELFTGGILSGINPFSQRNYTWSTINNVKDGFIFGPLTCSGTFVYIQSINNNNSQGLPFYSIAAPILSCSPFFCFNMITSLWTETFVVEEE